jgi:DNA repair protein RadC
MDTAEFSPFKVAEIEVTYKNKVNPSDRPKIIRSQDCYELLKSVWSDKIEYVEEFYVVLLNRANRVLGFSRISEGGLTGCVVDAKRVFQCALKANASSIILTHNHPSGQTQPSEADIQITKKIKTAGDYLEITVIDHIIVTPYAYYSFADEGIM